ncbi:MAG: cytochrome c3 family protein [Pirellulales bacterium]|nr:cytochrome c3 family protein [Pirellulales bacterium]
MTRASRIGWAALLVGAGLIAGMVWASGSASNLRQTQTWMRQASPGRLSAAHAFLEQNCAACHTAIKGAEASKCIACHADNPSLLQRQPTAFHATITSCAECHREHQGNGQRPTMMDHQALAKIGLRQIKRTESSEQKDQAYEQLVAWIEHHEATNEFPGGHPRVSVLEAALNCERCHSTKDPHYRFFGNDCVQCHSTTMWSIAEFRHPAPSSTDCAQCHQAPPSHYMGHFHMVSARVAGQEHAQVNQCYLCHQTTAWNDIKGVGFYKHH